MINNLIGMEFGRLRVVSRVTNDKAGNARWLCLCSCGNQKEVLGRSLTSGRTQSCGCLLSEKSSERMKKLLTKHGQSNSKLNHVYRSMKERCSNPNCKSYHNYGGRGIDVCNEWKDNFKNFYNWAINNGYRENLTIERINVNGNYEPSNCMWIPKKEQAQNMRKTKKIIINGIVYTTINRASRNVEISASTITRMLNGEKTKYSREYKISYY